MNYASVPFHLFLPPLAAIVFVAGAMFLKRAADLGANVWHSTRICNFMTAAAFAPLALFGGAIPSVRDLWQPAVVALLFVAGQILAVLALHLGDVSVATPVLGVKTVLVAGFAAALGQRLGTGLWTAAALSSAAIGVLHITSGQAHRRVSLTILLSVLAAAAYALFDVLVQRWSPAWGLGRFLPIAMGMAAVGSLALRPIGRARSNGETSGTPRAFAWVMGGAACFALQSLLIVSTIAFYGQATAANVLYSSRGLWSVPAVWLVGHWFKNTEQQHGQRILGWRLAGAALLLAAILIVLLGAR